MTEDELMNTWCPYMSGINPHPVIRTEDIPIQSRCIGRRCSQFRLDRFRWVSPKDRMPRNLGDTEAPPYHFPTSRRADDKSRMEDVWEKMHCYCGVAGKENGVP